MIVRRKWVIPAVALSCAGVVAGPSRVVAQSQGTTGQSGIPFSHALPHLDGGHLTVTVVEVQYGAGESSPPHSHPCAVVGYVVEGAVRMKVTGEAEAIYKAGESFYEAPNGVHAVSANASDKRPAKFIAYFVCDHDTPLSVPVPATAPSGHTVP